MLFLAQNASVSKRMNKCPMIRALVYKSKAILIGSILIATTAKSYWWRLKFKSNLPQPFSQLQLGQITGPPLPSDFPICIYQDSVCTHETIQLGPSWNLIFPIQDLWPIFLNQGLYNKSDFIYNKVDRHPQMDRQKDIQRERQVDASIRA